MLGWYFQTGHTWDWLGTEVFKSSLLSPHRHREDLHARFYLSSQILKRFSFPQALSVPVAREYTNQRPWKSREEDVAEINPLFLLI